MLGTSTHTGLVGEVFLTYHITNNDDDEGVVCQGVVWWWDQGLSNTLSVIWNCLPGSCQTPSASFGGGIRARLPWSCLLKSSKELPNTLSVWDTPGSCVVELPHRHRRLYCDRLERLRSSMFQKGRNESGQFNNFLSSPDFAC